MDISAFRELFRAQVRSQLVLEDEFLDLLLAAAWSREHLLFEGPPGTGKTSLAEVLGKLLGDYGRVQMTPETLPSDILGMEVLTDRESLSFEFRKGPIFHRLLIVDEINRATPRTQSALLQAMQEGQVQIGNESMPLDHGFLVIATLNPTQMDGTFVLPDSQLDRFGLCLEFNQPQAQQLEKALAFQKQNSPERPEGAGCPIMPEAEVPGEWLKVCSGIQSKLTQDQQRVNGIRPLGVRAYKTWLRLGQALSVIKGHSHLSTQCLRDLLGPVLMHRFGPFVDSEYLQELLSLFDRETGA